MSSFIWYKLSYYYLVGPLHVYFAKDTLLSHNPFIKLHHTFMMYHLNSKIDPKLAIITVKQFNRPSTSNLQFISKTYITVCFSTSFYTMYKNIYTFVLVDSRWKCIAFFFTFWILDSGGPLVFHRRSMNLGSHSPPLKLISRNNCSSIYFR